MYPTERWSANSDGVAARAMSSSGLLAALPQAVVFGLAMLVRLIHVSASGFPLGDGGLFLAMVERLQESHYHLPDSVTYNGGDLPFAYPPLGFYASALLSDLTGATPLEVMRWPPLALSIFTVGVVWALARSVLRERSEVLAAVFAFAMLPLAYRYFIMGAGITRSPGLLFAVTTVWLTYLLCTSKRPWLILPAILAASATILSHPNAAWFAAYSSALVVAFYGRDRRVLLYVLLVAAGAVALTAPWWHLVIERYGLTPFLSAPQSSNPGAPAWLLLSTLRITDEPLAPVIGMLAVVGALVCLREKRWWLPAWLLAACILDTRYSGTFAMVPLALLAGVGFGGMVELAWSQGYTHGLQRYAMAGIAAWLVLLSLANSLTPSAAPLALPVSQHDAMAWVASETPPDSAFLIIAPAGDSAGSESEWFPVLTGRRSLGTYQGSEWLEKQPGPSPWQRYNDLQDCADEDTGCLDRWAADAGSSFGYVYVREEDTDRLRASLQASPEYRLAYEGPDVWIFARVEAP